MGPPTRSNRHNDIGSSAGETAANEASSKDIELENDDDDSYEVACKDLKSLIKWNIKKLRSWGNPTTMADCILDEWDSYVRRVQELGRKHQLFGAYIDQLIRFQQFCCDLQSNNPKTVVLDTFRCPGGYALLLGGALLGNTHVSTLNVELDSLFPHNGRPLGPMEVCYLKPLLHYIESGPALRKLALNDIRSYGYDFHGRTKVSVANLFLRSAAASPNLEELDVHALAMERHIPEVCALLTQTASLRVLDVKMLLSTPECEQVAIALGTNRTLETLTFRPGQHGHSEFVDLVLSHLSVHPCLKAFHLRNACWIRSRVHLRLSSLPTFLQSPTSQLRSLYLEGCAFNNDSMKAFVLGLKTNRTLEKLILDICRMNGDAKAVFISFFQSTDKECQLRELGFRSNKRSLPLKKTTLDSAAASDLAIQLLQQRPSETNNTGESIGSSLERLTFDFKHPGAFWLAYASNASKIRLPYLHMGTLKDGDWEHLTQHMPSILYLRELSIDVHVKRVSASRLIRVLHRNGSLRVIHMKDILHVKGYEKDCLKSQTPTEKLLHESMLLRNHHVPKLLSSPRLHQSSTKEGGPDRAVDDEDNGTGTAPTMVPPLFQVMAPAERMQPNTVLLGLLAFKNSFGTSTAVVAKRSLPSGTDNRYSEEPPKSNRDTLLADSAKKMRADESAVYGKQDKLPENVNNSVSAFQFNLPLAPNGTNNESPANSSPLEGDASISESPLNAEPPSILGREIHSMRASVDAFATILDSTTKATQAAATAWKSVESNNGRNTVAASKRLLLKRLAAGVAQTEAAVETAKAAATYTISAAMTAWDEHTIEQGMNHVVQNSDHVHSLEAAASIKVNRASDICGQQAWDIIGRQVHNTWTIMKDHHTVEDAMKLLHRSGAAASSREADDNLAQGDEAQWTATTRHVLHEILDPLGPNPMKHPLSTIQWQVLKHRLSCVIVHHHFETLLNALQEGGSVPQSVVLDDQSEDTEMSKLAAFDTIRRYVLKTFTDQSTDTNGLTMTETHRHCCRVAMDLLIFVASEKGDDIVNAENLSSP